MKPHTGEISIAGVASGASEVTEALQPAQFMSPISFWHAIWLAIKCFQLKNIFCNFFFLPRDATDSSSFPSHVSYLFWP